MGTLLPGRVDETDAAEVEIEGVTQTVDFYAEVTNAIEVAPEIEILGV